MGNFTETSSFDATVYEVATTDAVLGGDTGPINVCIRALVNRTRWLKDQLAALTAASATLLSPVFTGNPTAPTPAAGDNSFSIATTAFASFLASGISAVTVGTASVVLTATQYGAGVIILSGTPSPLGDANVIFPNSGKWLVINRTTGAFNTTMKTAGGSGVTVTQGKSIEIVADGANVVAGVTDFSAIGAAAVKLTGSHTITASESGQTSWFSLAANATVTLDPAAVPAGWYATYSVPIGETHSVTFSAISGATLDGKTNRTGSGGTLVTIYFDGTNFSTRNGRYVFNVQITGWTNGSAQVNAHSLGILNKRQVSLSATCVTPEGGYAAADKITVGGTTINVNQTNAIVVIPTAGLTAVNQSTFATFTLTPANWTLNLTVETW